MGEAYIEASDYEKIVIPRKSLVPIKENERRQEINLLGALRSNKANKTGV